MEEPTGHFRSAGGKTGHQKQEQGTVPASCTQHHLRGRQITSGCAPLSLTPGNTPRLSPCEELARLPLGKQEREPLLQQGPQ